MIIITPYTGVAVVVQVTVLERLKKTIISIPCPVINNCLDIS
jgi:hypothetical protein